MAGGGAPADLRDLGPFPDRPDFATPRDMGPDDGRDCPEGRFPLDGACVDRCALVEALGCTDADGDCYPVDCSAAPFEDCDDGRPGTHPNADEGCDDLDNDCDGIADEGFGVGDACTGCGGAGKVECHADDLDRVACSTDPGQSQAPEPELTEERCNGADDDCDTEIDESCRFEVPEADRSQPIVCGERVLWVEGGVLLEVVADGARVVQEAPVAFPACEADTLAWLDPGEGCAAETGVTTCERGHLWIRDGGEPRDVTGIAVLGPPLVSGGHVYWHAMVGDAPVLSRQPVAGGGVETLFEGAAVSDPTPPVEGAVAARFWTGGEAEVAVRDLETQRGSDLLGPEGAPGVPVANAAWVVWPAGEQGSLWVVERAHPRSGFQLTMRDGPQRTPRLDGDRLVWLDESVAPAVLRSFDLRTGLGDEVASGDIAADGFAVGPGVVVWIDGGAVYRHRWAP